MPKFLHIYFLILKPIFTHSFSHTEAIDFNITWFTCHVCALYAPRPLRSLGVERLNLL